MAMGKKTGRGVFWEEEMNGYQWCDRKVSWRKERSGLRESTDQIMGLTG